MRHDAPNPGELIAGKYRVHSILGRGRGTLVLAEHVSLEQRVAIRIVTPSLSDPVAVAKYRREARVLAKLGSEHVARILDVGVLTDGSFYLVRQYLEGADLCSTLRERRKLPVDEAIGWVLQATEAVAETHAFGILVRELSPEHLFLAERSPGVRGGPRVLKITDFGTAKVLRQAQPGVEDYTATTALGLSPYSSPEMLRRQRDVDSRTDVWSLGAILYEMLSGQPPFGRDMVSLAIAISREEPAALSNFRDDVPPEVEAAIRQALSKDKNARPADAHAFAAQLARYAPAQSLHLMERIRDLADSARARTSGAKGAEDEGEEISLVDELDDPETGEMEAETQVGRPEDIVRRLPPPPARPPAPETQGRRSVTQEKTEALGFNFVPNNPHRSSGNHAFAGAAAGLEPPEPTQMLPALRSPSQPSFEPKTTPPPPISAAMPPMRPPASGFSSQDGFRRSERPASPAWKTAAPLVAAPAAPESSNSRKVALFAVGGALAALWIMVIVVIALPKPPRPKANDIDAAQPAPPGAGVVTSVTPGRGPDASATQRPVTPYPSLVEPSASPTASATPSTTNGRPPPSPAVSGAPSKSDDGTLVAVAVGGTCTFSVNGIPKGVTNSLKLNVSPGSYLVACKPFSGATQTKSVTVKSGASAMASFKVN